MKEDESVRAAVHRALDGMVRPAPELSSKVLERVRRQRRAASKGGFRRWGQAAGVLGAAAVVAVVGIAIHQASFKHAGPAQTAAPSFAAPVSVAKGPGAAIAWLDNLTGIDPNGHVVGKIPLTALRSPDGNTLYALVGHNVAVYSATTASLQRMITLTSYGDVAALSPDGRYLAILGGGPPSAVEMIDLATGRSVGHATMGSAFSSSIVGFLLFSADGSRVVAVANFWSKTAVAVLRFDGSTLRVERQASDGQQGHRLPSCDGMAPENAAGGLPERLLADGNTMVSFCPGNGLTTWLDLNRLTISATVQVQEANPFWLSPVFSSDGSMLYVHEPGTGRLTSVDLKTRKTIRSAVINGPTALNPLQWLADRLFPPAFAGGIPRSATLSPDGTVLYVTGALGRPTGVAAITVRDFHVAQQWKLDGGGSLWLSGDGKTVYATSNAGDRLSILHLDTGSVVTVTLTPLGYDFLPIPN